MHTFARTTTVVTSIATSLLHALQYPNPDAQHGLDTASAMSMYELPCKIESDPMMERETHFQKTASAREDDRIWGHRWRT